MQYPQTRYQDTIATAITDSALSLTAGTTAPTRTEGILTIGRLTSNTEDVYYNAVAGQVVTISLRGLSQTALTLTEVAGNKKAHSAAESLEITTHHNYDTNKARKDETETISGVWTMSGANTHSGANTFSATNTFSGNNNTFTGTGNRFSSAVRIPGILDSGGNEAIDIDATASAVNQLRVINAIANGNVILTTAGDDADIDLEFQAKGTGVIIVENGAVMKTSAAPTTDAMISNKKYVDDSVTAGVATSSITTHIVYTSAFLTGGTAPTDNYLLWLGTSNGAFNITINGTLRAVTGIDFTTGVASMADVASKIQTAIRALTASTETVTWSGTQFTVSSVLTTSSSAISLCSAPGAGTDISGAGATAFMDCDSGSAAVVTPRILNKGTNVGKLVLLDANGEFDEQMLPLKFGGTGSDGQLKVSSGTTNIDLSSAAVTVKNYSYINIYSGATLGFTNPPTAGATVILKCSGECIIA